MVHLYGVTHEGQWITFFQGYAGRMIISPTEKLISDLSKFPRGTKVGLECMCKQDWEEVEAHLFKLPFNPPEPRFDDQEYASRPYYEKEHNDYWVQLGRVCSNLGFEVIFLENKNVWFEYNKTMVRFAENEAKRRNLLVVEKGESDEHYDRKRIGFNVERYKEMIFVRKIHEIEDRKSVV